MAQVEALKRFSDLPCFQPPKKIILAATVFPLQTPAERNWKRRCHKSL